MNILVTGGAGYIGSFVVKELLDRKHHVVVLDNLQQGHKSAVLAPATLIQGNILDREVVTRILSENRIETVMHLAAESVVPVSNINPKECFNINLVGSINLLDSMLQTGVNKIIFSSSAAVYGDSDKAKKEEHDIKMPINAYGDSKLMFEKILDWYGKAYALKHITLRFFNAAGASQQLGEDHRPETHLIPLVLKRALAGTGNLLVYGSDCRTKDGTCIRDYVHVQDIALAHVLAMEHLGANRRTVYNIGNQDGYSVLDIIHAAERITGATIPFKVVERRPGDPDILVSASIPARDELGWEPQMPCLDEIVGSAWTWIVKHPEGYGPD